MKISNDQKFQLIAFKQKVKANYQFGKNITAWKISTPIVRPTGQWMFVVTISRRDASEPSSSARSIFRLTPQSVQNRYLQRCTQICNEKAGTAASHNNTEINYNHTAEGTRM